MKSSIKSLVALLAITAVAGTVHARHGSYSSGSLVDVKVENDIRMVGRIYVHVKSANHETKRRAIWGIKSAHIMFSKSGVNKICAYTSKRNPTERFVYKLTLRDGMYHCVKLQENQLIYTYIDGNDIKQEVIIEGTRQELVNGEWRNIQ